MVQCLVNQEVESDRVQPSLGSFGFPSYSSGQPIQISVILVLDCGAGAAGPVGTLDIVGVTGDEVPSWQKRTRDKARPFVRNAGT